MAPSAQFTRMTLLILALSLGCCKGGPIKYQTAAKRDPVKLNVHLVPHTHDDSGWLKTFEQYYWGSRNDIQTAAVQHVLSTVVQALRDNPDRRFAYAELSFFSRWWQLQPEPVRDQVRQLVAAGRLDFINGGFVQHDEATAHYAAMIDQTTRGHRFLNATFGFRPRVAWQIDPFGHSATQAALLSAAAGFEALFFGRADYQDMQIRSARRQLELLWRPAASWGRWGQVWTHNYPTGNYGPPPGFDFNWASSLDPPIVDDPSSPEFNVQERVDAFVAQATAWSRLLQGNDVLMMMGSDFQHANAHATFINLDRLIHHVNADGRVNVFYSTPADYVAAKAAYNGSISWPVKTDDFFPYADCQHCYWTGYFTSRPTSKGYMRTATAYLAAARQLQALTPSALSSSNSEPRPLDQLEFAVSLSQHHDAITGTAKQAVANDYARYLYLGLHKASQLVDSALQQLLTPAPSFSATSSPSGGSIRARGSSTANPQRNAPLAGIPNLLAWLQHLRLGSRANLLMPADREWNTLPVSTAGATDEKAWLGQLQLSQCPLLNVSICEATVTTTTTAMTKIRQSSSRHGPRVVADDDGSGSLLVVVYNSLAWPRSEFVRVPVAAPGDGASYSVQDAEGFTVPSQLLPVSQATKQLQAAMTLAELAPAAAAATHELVFKADTPPLGYASYAVLATSSDDVAAAHNSSITVCSPESHKQQQQQQIISNGLLNVTLDTLSGRLSAVSAADGSWSVAVSQELMWYKSSTGYEPSAAATTAAANTAPNAAPTATDASAGGTPSGSRSDVYTGSTDDGSKAVDSHCSSKDGQLKGGQSSGAYIFRPAGDAPGALALVPPEQPLQTSVVQGPLLTEIRQVWSSWASLTVRLWAGAAVLEQEWTVGPIPSSDGIGKETIVRTSTNLTTGGVLFTDSNGRGMLRRELNKRPTWQLELQEPVAANYYPITTAAAVTDGFLSLGLATDRGQGAASLEEGRLEVMVHRLTTVDDARGVEEPLRETLCGCTACSCPAGNLPARGRHMLVVGPALGAARTLRVAAQQLNDPLLLVFGKLPAPVAPPATAAAGESGGSSSSSSSSDVQGAEHTRGASNGIIPALNLRGRWSGLTGGAVSAGLPANVHLLTLMRADEADSSRLTLRLAHMFQVGEDAELSQPARVDLSQLLGLPVARVAELSLTAAQHKSEMSPPREWPEGAVLGAPAAAAAAGTAERVDTGPAARFAWGDVAARAHAAAHRHHLYDHPESAESSSGPARPVEAEEAAAEHGAQRTSRRLSQRHIEHQHDDAATAAAAAGQQDEEQVYNIWEHPGDAGSVIELFPMEIRTWEVTLG